MKKTISAPCGITARQFILGSRTAKNQFEQDDIEGNFESSVDQPRGFANAFKSKFQLKRKNSQTVPSDAGDGCLLLTKSLEPGAFYEQQSKKSTKQLLEESNTLTLGYISSPMDDFRHTAHLGAKGESSGDLTFLEYAAKGRAINKNCGLQGDVLNSNAMVDTGIFTPEKTRTRSKIEGMKELFSNIKKTKKFSLDGTTGSGDSALDACSVGNESKEDSINGNILDCEIISMISDNLTMKSDVTGLLDEFMDIYMEMEQATIKKSAGSRLSTYD